MKYVVVTEMDQVAYVKLHRPEVRNAFNPEMIAELTQLFLDLDKRTDLRVVTLSGEGKTFCAGADLGWMKEMANFTYEQNIQDSQKLFAMFEAIANCSLPVIGSIHGAAFGGAMGLIACCDEVLVDETTEFCFSEVKLGLAPAVISSFILRKASVGFVRPLMLSGVVFDCEDAYLSGLIHQVVPTGEMAAALQSLVQTYAEAGPEAVRATKKLIDQVQSHSWAEQKKLTTQVIAERRVSAEGQEGLKSFFERRKPSWRNS